MGTVAKKPNRPGWAATRSAPKSLRSRASAAASAAVDMIVVPGVDTDRIAVAMSSSVIVSSDASALQSGTARPPAASIPAFCSTFR